MGKIIIVKEYLLVKRTQYEKLGNPLALTLDLKSVPLEVYEARNAVEIARSRGADKYSPEIFSKAEAGLQLTEAALARKKDRKEIISTARMAAQSSEDARALAAQHQEERIAQDKAAAAARAKEEAEAKAAAEAAEVKRRSDEEAHRQAELAAAREARFKAEAEAKEARMKAAADLAAARAKAAVRRCQLLITTLRLAARGIVASNSVSGELIGVKIGTP